MSLKNSIPLALGLTLNVFGISSAGAQTTAAPDPYPQVRAQLRTLVTAQEAYYADHGTYTTDLAALQLLHGTVRDTIWLRIIHAGGRSWAGDGGHLAVPGKSCVIYIGLLEDFASIPRTRAADLLPANEGEPRCDEP